jgi:hypothetical protein
MSDGLPDHGSGRVQLLRCRPQKGLATLLRFPRNLLKSKRVILAGLKKESKIRVNLCIRKGQYIPLSVGALLGLRVGLNVD